MTGGTDEARRLGNVIAYNANAGHKSKWPTLSERDLRRRSGR